MASCPSQVSHAPEGTFLLYSSSRASLSPHTSFVCLTAWLAKEGTSQPGPASQRLGNEEVIKGPMGPGRTCREELGEQG